MIEKIQTQAKIRGLISPIDVGVQFFRTPNAPNYKPNLRTLVSDKVNRIKRMLIGILQSPPVWSKGILIFFPVEPTHLSQMIPIAKRLQSRGVPFQFVTTRVRIFSIIRRQSLPVYLIKTGYPLQSKSSMVMDLDEIPAFGIESPVYTGLEYLRRLHSDMVDLSNGFLRILETKPGYIIVGNDMTWEGRLLVRLSQFAGIRTGMIQHGLIGRDPYVKHHIVQDFFLYGQASKLLLESEGLAETKLLVCGAPYLDSHVWSASEFPNKVLKSTFRLGSKFILIALSGYGHRTSIGNYRATLSILQRLIQDHPELEFIIKLHRKERIKDYSAFPKEVQNRIVDRRKGRALPLSIFEWLKGCKCLITGTSTVAYEAMHMNVPVISIDPLRQFYGIDFIDENAARVVHTIDELEKALLTTYEAPYAARRFISQVFYQGEASASECIMDYVSGFLKSK